jgi:DNA polymerase III delta prime subunit
VSDNLFFEGPKFIILDEVDYMTKSAQLALKYLIEYYSNYNVRYCLICNYITKIDNNLQSYFCKLKFNNIPFEEIHTFLSNICINEKLTLSTDYLYHIIYLFKNDIRAMINFLQLNNNNIIYFIDTNVYEKLYSINLNDTYEVFKKNFIAMEKKYKFNYIEFIKMYIFNILKSNIHNISDTKINCIEFFVYNYNKLSDKNIIMYNLYNLIKL